MPYCGCKSLPMLPNRAVSIFILFEIIGSILISWKIEFWFCGTRELVRGAGPYATLQTTMLLYEKSQWNKDFFFFFFFFFSSFFFLFCYVFCLFRRTAFTDFFNQNTGGTGGSIVSECRRENGLESGRKTVSFNPLTFCTSSRKHTYIILTPLNPTRI